MKDLQKLISSYKDFPRKGIIFKDLLGILRDPELFKELIIRMSESFIVKECDAIASIDARGFIFASSLAYNLSKGIVMIRKKNKLPGKTISLEYDLEYGKDTLEVNIKLESQKIVLIDDLLATGGTAKAACELIKKAGGIVTCFISLIELNFLNGRNQIDVPIETLIQY